MNHEQQLTLPLPLSGLYGIYAIPASTQQRSFGRCLTNAEIIAHHSPTAAAGDKQLVTVVITKPSKDCTFGIGMESIRVSETSNNWMIKVTSIAPTSLFNGSNLEVGMVLRTVNGKAFNTCAECVELLKAAEGRVTILASPAEPKLWAC